MANGRESGIEPVPNCTIAAVLEFIAILELIGALIGGIFFGQNNPSLGWMVFISCALGGVFVFGFAYALQYLHAIAHRLERIESIQKTAK